MYTSTLHVRGEDLIISTAHPGTATGSDTDTPGTMGAEKVSQYFHRQISDSANVSLQSLRDRLIQSLGPRYHSVEEHRYAARRQSWQNADVRLRLDQSDRYDTHWKRWGPYVSERQWVSSHITLVTYCRGRRDIRVPCERITRPMEMPGIRSLSKWRRAEPTDGVKMVSQGSRGFLLAGRFSLS